MPPTLGSGQHEIFHRAFDALHWFFVHVLEWKVLLLLCALFCGDAKKLEQQGIDASEGPHKLSDRFEKARPYKRLENQMRSFVQCSFSCVHTTSC